VLDEPVGPRGGDKALPDALPGIVSGLLTQEQTVLVVRATRPDRRSRWVKAFREPAASVDCEAPTRKPALLAFVRKEADRQGLALEAGVAELLVERVGPHLLALRQELAKASLFAGEGGRVTAAHASELTSDLAEEPIWDLTDAIGDGRTSEALVVLAKLVGAGAPPPVLLGALASHFRRLVRVRNGSSVPAPPFVRKKLEQQASRYSVRRVEDCLRNIHATDEALKGQGVLPPDLALERLVLALAS